MTENKAVGKITLLIQHVAEIKHTVIFNSLHLNAVWLYWFHIFNKVEYKYSQIMRKDIHMNKLWNDVLLATEVWTKGS